MEMRNIFITERMTYIYRKNAHYEELAMLRGTPVCKNTNFTGAGCMQKVIQTAQQKFKPQHNETFLSLKCYKLMRYK